MKQRSLGKTGITVSEIGLGTWELAGDVWGPKDDSVSIRALNEGLDNGANFIDTAAGYGKGHAEEIVGRVLAGRPRDSVVITTKIYPEAAKFAPPPEDDIDDFYSPAWIEAQCDESLRRLGTDYIDILFMHTWSAAWGHADAWFEAMSRLKRAGKIRAIGISVPDEGPADANVQIARGQVDVVQCVYSVFQQEPEYSLLPLAEKFGVGVVARSPFSSGVLAEDWQADHVFSQGDWRASWPASVVEGWFDLQRSMAAGVKPVLTGSGSYAQACLRFVLRSKAVSVVIPGSSNPLHVRENLAASEMGGLTAEQLRLLKELWLKREIHGTYNGSV